MERIPLEGPSDLHKLITGFHNLLFADELAPDEIEVYFIDSEYVEAEIDLPHIGLNKKEWEADWSNERKIEVLLHEFAHIEEGPDEPDHGAAFYERLAELTTIAEQNHGALEDLFGADLDFDEVRAHIVDSVNEYTVESDTDTVTDRKRTLRQKLSTVDTTDPEQ